MSFEPEIKRGVKVIAIPEAQEVGDLPCDTGSDPEVLRKEMEGKPVDLSLVHDGWNNKKGKWATDADAIEARAKDGRQWLKARSEKEIVIVTHGGFLHFFTEDWADTRKYQGRVATSPQRLLELNVTGTGWANTEFRTYQFKDGYDDRALLIETAESRRLRTGREMPLTETEQSELKQVAMKTWSDLGYQPSSNL